MTEMYARLAAHFDKHHKDPRGLDYLTGAQVVGRLNEVLGPAGWSFSVKEHGYDEESDEMWALGRLEACIDGVPLVREQFGSQKHNRLRSTSKIIDYGFDAKGAATDAMKKCATLIGVGLYLSEKDGGIPQSEHRPAPKDNSTSRERPSSGGAGRQAPPIPFASTRERDVDDTFKCVTCGNNIVAQTGEVINANQADTLLERDGVLTCRDHRPKKAATA